MRNPFRLLARGAAIALGVFSLVDAGAQTNASDRTWGTPFPAPAFPFGAVYFRKSSPPESDWAHDHEVAAGLGMNIFRHWFMWASIENAPDRYDWADYDRLVQLEGQHQIKVIIAENVTGAPEWMWDKYPHARRLDREGVESYPGVVTGSATGNALLCLDNEDVRTRAEKFLTALVARYRDKPALLGYDLWNEGSVQECTCAASQEKFRAWLQVKYSTIDALGRAWHRSSLGDWASVHPPRGNIGYADSLDWLQFTRDNALRLLRWRVALVRRLDPHAKITAHGTGTLSEVESRTAADVDSYGFTWVASRHTNAPWMQFRAADWTRAAAHGKEFWHAEATGGPLWLQPQVLNRPLEDGRSSDEKDVRVWSLIDMAAGARGIQFTRWRPLLDGPLFGAFGPMGMDGAVTPRAEMAGQLARWANAHPELWQSRPVRGDVGIVFVQESMDFAGVQGTGGGRAAGGEGGGNFCAQSLQGAYQAFFDSNIQADFVRLEDIDSYPLIYLPYPTHLKKSTADKLRAYVAQGGKLVSEGCPGYFGDGGRVGTTQPNLGLDELFGARESYVQFTPDLLTQLTASVRGHPVGGQFFLQEYQLAGGTAAGNFANGHLAAVENKFGRGQTLLIGTFPGGAYDRSHAADTRTFFADLLAWAGLKPEVQSSDAEVMARLHRGAGGTYLWIVNPTRAAKTVKISLPATFNSATELWPDSTPPTLSGNTVTTTIADRNAAVIRLN